MTDFGPVFDDLEPFFGNNELQSPATLLSNELDFSSLHLSSTASLTKQQFTFEAKVREGSSCSLKLIGPAVSYGVNRFVCYLDTSSSCVLAEGDVVNRNYPFDKNMLVSSNGEIEEKQARLGVLVTFKPRVEGLVGSVVHVFHIQSNDSLLCCASIGTKVKQDSLSDAIDSLCDSDTIEQFDINELDNYNAPLNTFTESLSRKRSFLNREDVATTASSSYHDQEDLYISSFSQSKGLKKLKSARNLQKDLLIHHQMQNQAKVSQLLSRSSAFSTVSSLNRCASAPPRKMKQLINQQAKEKKMVFSVITLLTDISNGSENRFVVVLTKFILSDKETLTKVIQRELRCCSRPEKIFIIFYQFLYQNFPPFQVYCSKLGEVDEDIINKNLNNLTKQQFDDISINTNHVNTMFDRFKGPWKVIKERKKNIFNFYSTLGFSKAISGCYTAIDSIISISYDTMTSSLLLNKQEKLFSQSKQQYIADGVERRWKICNPLLQEEQNFSSYRCTSSDKESKFSVEKVVIGNKVKMRETFEIGENNQLECSYCLFKANVKANEDWTLVYSTLVIFDKL